MIRQILTHFVVETWKERGDQIPEVIFVIGLREF